MRKYFGTDGVRGEVGVYPITPDFALKLGYAAGRVISKNNPKAQVIIGKDTRLSGYLFESALEAGFAYAGVDVYMAGPLPTPAIAYLTSTLRLSLGVVISASHNPYTDNGIKFFSRSGTKLDNQLEQEIEYLIDQKMTPGIRLGKVWRMSDAKGRYIEFCKSTFPSQLDLSGFKIVLDCANGATYDVAPHVFTELGAEVIPIATNPDGININAHCGSTNPTNLIQAVLENQATLGIAFDGDGDRVIFCDNKGKIYDGDKLVYLILKSYLGLGKKISGVVGTVMTNMGLELALNRQGLELIRTPVGDRYIVQELLNRNWLIGGEASGHILCLDKHSTGDGIIAALQVLVGLILNKKTLNQVIDFEDFPQIMVNVHLNTTNDWEDKTKQLIQKLELELNSQGRIIVRKSGTEPVVRVMVEAKDEKIATHYANDIVQAING